MPFILLNAIFRLIEFAHHNQIPRLKKLKEMLGKTIIQKQYTPFFKKDLHFELCTCNEKVLYRNNSFYY